MIDNNALVEKFRGAFPDAPLTYLDYGDGLFLLIIDSVCEFEESIPSAIARYDFRCRPIRTGRLDCCYYGIYSQPEKGTLRWYYSEKEQTLRVIKDDAQNYALLENRTKGNMPIRFWQYEIDHSMIDCGMCYIFQLTDGSFFIIDASDQYSMHDPERLSAFLSARTPDGQPFVRGWFFSHAHSDHICTAMEIMSYFPEVCIGTLYYNFPFPDVLAENTWSPSDRQIARRFLETVRMQERRVCTVHPFDLIDLGDVKCRVLCGYEDLLPGPLSYFNDTSTVLMAEVGEEKVCFPCDAGHEESKLLELRFPEYLSCDIVQASHHGHFGTTPEFYRLCAAKTVLFPTTQIKFDEEFHRYPANETAVDIAEHCFIASNGTVEFAFPLKEHKIRVFPDETLENFDAIYTLWTYSYPRERKEQLREDFLSRNEYKELDW